VPEGHYHSASCCCWYPASPDAPRIHRQARYQQPQLAGVAEVLAPAKPATGACWLHQSLLQIAAAGSYPVLHSCKLPLLPLLALGVLPAAAARRSDGGGAPPRQGQHPRAANKAHVCPPRIVRGEGAAPGHGQLRGGSREVTVQKNWHGQLRGDQEKWRCRRIDVRERNLQQWAGVAAAVSSGELHSSSGPG